jgi:hypothetical protein
VTFLNGGTCNSAKADSLDDRRLAPDRPTILYEGFASFSWNVSDPESESREFLCRLHSPHKAETFKSAKLAASYIVTEQQLLVFDKPLP